MRVIKRTQTTRDERARENGPASIFAYAAYYQRLFARLPYLANALYVVVWEAEGPQVAERQVEAEGAEPAAPAHKLTQVPETPRSQI